MLSEFRVQHTKRPCLSVRAASVACILLELLLVQVLNESASCHSLLPQSQGLLLGYWLLPRRFFSGLISFTPAAVQACFWGSLAGRSLQHHSSPQQKAWLAMVWGQVVGTKPRHLTSTKAASLGSLFVPVDQISATGQQTHGSRLV